MSPRRITLFFACVIAALAVICAIFPADGITVGSHSYYLPSIHSLAEATKPIPREPETKEISDTVPSEVSELADSIDYFQSLSDSGDLRFWLPDSQYFASFWEAAEQAASRGRILRVMHYGDSQIEMDRITSRLRSYMQETFGGGGPGMIPYRTIIPTPAVHQSTSGNLIHLASFGDSTVTHSRGNYGPMMQCFRSSGEAIVRIKAANIKSVDDRVKEFSHIRLVYNSKSGSLKSILSDRDNSSNDTLQSDSIGVGSFVWILDSTSTSVSLKTRGNADLYCITVDNGPGVAVDNIPMRGCSGQQFTLVKQEFLTQAYDQLDVGMIILQFGGNSVPYLKSEKSISTYCHSIGRQIDYLHLCCPRAKILFIGPSDMSTRHKGTLQTYPMLPVLIDSLIATANSHGAAYWSIYHAMGGFNSMVNWSHQGLAGSDYIHFSQRGADLMGDRLAEAFAESYRLYSLRRRLKQVNP